MTLINWDYAAEKADTAGTEFGRKTFDRVEKKINDFEELQLLGMIGFQSPAKNDTIKRSKFQTVATLSNARLPSNKGPKNIFIEGQSMGISHFMKDNFLSDLRSLYWEGLPDVISEFRDIFANTHEYHRLPSALVTSLINFSLLITHWVLQSVELFFQTLSLPSQLTSTALKNITDDKNSIFVRGAYALLLLAVSPFQIFSLIGNSINYIRHVIDGSVTMAKSIVNTVLDVVFKGVGNLLTGRNLLDGMNTDVNRGWDSFKYAFTDTFKNIVKLIPAAIAAAVGYFTFGAAFLAPVVTEAAGGSVISVLQTIGITTIGIAVTTALAMGSKLLTTLGVRTSRAINSFFKKEEPEARSSKEGRESTAKSKKDRLKDDAPRNDPSSTAVMARSMPTQPLHVVSFDFDGCLFNNAYKEHYQMDQGMEGLGQGNLEERSVIHVNKPLLDRVKQAKPPSGHSYSETIVMNGSNRQSHNSDATRSGIKSGKSRTTESSFEAIDKVSKYLGGTLDTFLLADVYGNKSPGAAHQEALNNNTKTHADWQVDNYKITIIYAQVHKIASENPGREIHFDFYDDDARVLRALDKYFQENPDKLPEKVNLRLNQYKPDKTEEIKTKCIQGTGKTDNDYAQTVRNMKPMEHSVQEAPLRANDAQSSSSPPTP